MGRGLTVRRLSLNRKCQSFGSRCLLANITHKCSLLPSSRPSCFLKNEDISKDHRTVSLPSHCLLSNYMYICIGSLAHLGARIDENQEGEKNIHKNKRVGSIRMSVAAVTVQTILTV